MRSNVIGRIRRIARFGRRHRTATFVSALVAMSLCLALVPGEGLEGSLVQTAVLAVVALVAVLFADARSLGKPAALGRGLRWWAVVVLGVGLAAGLCGLWLAGPSPASGVEAVGDAADFAVRLAALVAICLLTGVFEEGVFRVLAIDALAPQFGGDRGLLKAAVWSSVLFGVLHVSGADALGAGGVVAWAQAVVKPLQGALFGFFMAALYARTRSLWTAAALHGAFDLLYLGPAMLAEGAPQVYVTGSLADLAVLAAATALLVPPAVAAYRSFGARTA